jgi:hypothetical protein
MNLKSSMVQKYWSGQPVKIDYSQMDKSIIKEFKGSHPHIMKDWLPAGNKIFKTSSNYKPTSKQKKHQILIKVENFFGVDFSKKHYKLV